MEWIEIGRHEFDLGEVAHVAKGDRSCEAENTLVVALKCGQKIHLVGEEAKAFSAIFRDFTAPLKFGKPPPAVFVPTSASRRRPSEVVGVEQEGIVGLDSPRHHQEA